MKFEIEGMSELQNKLSRLAGSVTTGNVVTEGLSEGAKMIQSTAKRLAPVDEGQLRNSIIVQVVDTGVVDVAATAEHAIYNEYGTGKLGDPSVPHTTKDSWVYKGSDGKFYTTHGMEPRPFMYPALQTHKDDVVRILKEHLQKAVDGHG